MIYPFQCDKCGKYIEVVRPSSDSGLPQSCECGQVMRRVYTATLFAIDKQDYFDYGLGCHVRNRSDVNEAIRRLRDGKKNGRDVVVHDDKGVKHIEKRDVEGIDVVEIGNQRPKADIKKDNYDIPRGLI